MQARFKAADPAAIDMTMTITMSLAEWKKVREVLQKDGCSYILNHAIRSMVCQAEANFAPQNEEQPQQE